MLIVERQDKLLEFLREHRTAQLEMLCEHFDVSASTIRRDLEALERRGLIERAHGGAIYRGPQLHSPVFDERMQVQVQQKHDIGRRFAAMVQPGMTLLLDGGSTVLMAAQQITQRPLQVVTSSIRIAQHFSDDENVELVLLGGTLYPRTGIVIGPIATHALSNLHADLAVFSIAGIFEQDCYNQNLAMAELEKLMIQQAARSVILADASKFGRKSMARVCHVDQVELIITDAGISDRWKTQFGDRLAIAPNTPTPNTDS